METCVKRVIENMRKAEGSFWEKYSSEVATFQKQVLEGIWFEADGYNPLPATPDGYVWVIDNGGLSTGQTISYRLWCPSLGYMPQSE